MARTTAQKSNTEFSVQNLTVNYGGKTPAINALSLEIEAGTFNVLLGQNGSGKSTLLRCLGGMQSPYEGEILRLGRSRRQDYSDFNSQIISVSEEIALPFFNLEKLSAIYKEIWPTFDQETFLRILSVGDISPKKRSDQISRGQNILAQFALGLASKCSTILIDEVTAVLDPYIRRFVVKELSDHQKRNGATIVLATNVATEIVDTDVRIFLIKAGKVFISGTYESLVPKFIKILIKSEQIRPPPIGFSELSSEGNDIVYIGLAGAEKKLTEAFTVLNKKPTMEEMFIYLSDRRI